MRLSWAWRGLLWREMAVALAPMVTAAGAKGGERRGGGCGRLASDEADRRVAGGRGGQAAVGLAVKTRLGPGEEGGAIGGRGGQLRGAQGRVTVTVVPSASEVVKVIRPPWALAINCAL